MSAAALTALIFQAAATQPPPPEMVAVSQLFQYLPVVPPVLSAVALLWGVWSYVCALSVEGTSRHVEKYDHLRLGHTMMACSAGMLFIGTPVAMSTAASFAAQM